MKILLIIGCLSLILSASPKEFENGKKIYEKACVSCHGIDGTTNPAMKFLVKPRKLSESILTKEQSYKIIEEGARKWGAHSDMMPAFEKVLSKYELGAVSAYITQAFNSNRDERVEKLMDESQPIAKSRIPEMLPEGKKIYKRNCALCHGIDGSGDSYYVEQTRAEKEMIYPYSLRKAKLNEDQIFLYTKYGGQFWGANKSDMPAWSHKYDDFQLKSVAKYIVENIQEGKK